MNPLLPVTEPCGGSTSDVPFSFGDSRVLLLLLLLARAAEPRVGLLCRAASRSAPLSIVSGGGDEDSLASPSVEENTT